MFYSKTYLRYYLLLAILPKYNATKESQSDIKGRFLKDLDDEEWHVSHLRDLELGQGCQEDTFADKAKRYRKTLKNDGALVEFVSSNAIPFNPYDNDKDKCKVDRSFFKKPIVNTSLDNSTNIKREESEVKTATVSSRVGLEDQMKMVENNVQRRSEYQFSSVEYYDEIQDFDASLCPDDVAIIKLEMDQLRNYYVECEAIVEWRSLE